MKFFCTLIFILVLACGCGRIEGLVDLEVEDSPIVTKFSPIVALTGSKNIRFSIKRFLSKDFLNHNSFEEIQAFLELNGSLKKLNCVSGSPWLYENSGVITSPGKGDIVLFKNNKEILRLKSIFNSIHDFKITMTFDDGPGVNKKSKPDDISSSPTILTLNKLDNFSHGKNGIKKGIKAAFFILSTSDSFFKVVYNKAETQQGKSILKEVASRGNVIGVHSGGRYGSQFNSHDKRVLEPSYAVCGRSVGDFDNALEADLYECINVIEKVTGKKPEFVRPPLWRYKNTKNSLIGELVKKAYEKYSLKMILTDAKFPDGGYYTISIVAVQKYIEFKRNLRRAFLSGENNLVISMHDSNKYTANIVDNILDMIVDEFEQIEFSGVKARAEDRLDFADTYNEVRNNLLNKSRFVMFPEYNSCSNVME